MFSFSTHLNQLIIFFGIARNVKVGAYVGIIQLCRNVAFQKQAWTPLRISNSFRNLSKPTGKNGGILGIEASVPTKAFHDKMAAKDFKTKTMKVLSSIQS